ncbi:prolipoprotein diacylglyceryl transferase [Flectobacillus sp. DC10W]|jgi:prolipoprotein diacylglyceryl transferase|uniref:Phosphatidylglycerol--prolipoprotein diacylglyceryl transferase n=1 Tax=Flectobacillus longus TaxID=2984207 RepID=A0ABT6YPN1_9BACT|nr:prolipoprotein diacylglyceryl transferase [Flectobacillus longus]MDI9865123.1 prolipoprotein diacylglyceryl transferase [Flectobacillus longus]
MLAYIDWFTSSDIFTFPESLPLIGGLPVRWYGVMFATAFLLGYQVISYFFKKEGRPLEQADELLLYAMIATVLGARMGHYFFYEYPTLLSNPGHFFWSMIRPPYAGLASHGAAIGLFLAFYLYVRKHKDISYLYVTDRVVPTVALGGACIRIGNLMNSEIVGKETDLPWAFKFYNDPSLNHDYFAVVPRHPAQLYEALSCIVLFVILFMIWNKKKEKTQEGLMTGVFMVVLFILRFFYEFIKENQVSFEDGMSLNMGQWLSIPAILFGLGVLWYSFKNKKAV